MSRVFIMGLGEIGFNTAMYYIDNGCSVFGWDINKEARENARKNGVYVSEFIDDFDFGMFEVYSICVPTKAVYEVVNVLVKNHELLERDYRPLLIIESTVIPGTCKIILEDLLQNKLGIAHVPQRYWAEDPHGRGVRRKRVVAASDDDLLCRTIKFLKSMNLLVFPVYGLEVAELCKVAENAYRNVMISYAEELFGVCKELDIDFWAVKEAIETHQTIGYMLEPREGVGGHCLPMAAEIMQDLSKHNDIIVGARNADARYRKLIEEEK